MSKHTFTSAERFAIWQNFDLKCFWCLEPLRLMDVTIDHILPEHLLDNKDEFDEIIRKYALPKSFKINDFGNWVPCHSSCNSKKGGRVLPGSPAFLILLDGVQKKSARGQQLHEKLLKNSKADKKIGEILTSLEKGDINDSDLLIILTRNKSKNIDFAEKEKKFSEVIPKGWKLIHTDNYGHGVIANGRVSGLIPLSVTPHHSWLCPHCGLYGPWQGSRCMSCGKVSVELD